MTYAICFSLTPLSFTIVKQTSVSGKIFFTVFIIFLQLFTKPLQILQGFCAFSLVIFIFMKQIAL